MLTEGSCNVKSDTKYCEFVGSSCLFKKWRYGSEFLAGVVDYHFMRLICVQLKVISSGPFSDVEFIADQLPVVVNYASCLPTSNPVHLAYIQHSSFLLMIMQKGQEANVES